MPDYEKSCCNGELVCVKCAARMIGITADMVRAQARAGLLPGVRRLGVWAFSSEAVQQAAFRREENAKQSGLGLVLPPLVAQRPRIVQLPQRMPLAA